MFFKHGKSNFQTVKFGNLIYGTSYGSDKGKNMTVRLSVSMFVTQFRLQSWKVLEILYKGTLGIGQTMHVKGLLKFNYTSLDLETAKTS